MAELSPMEPEKASVRYPVKKIPKKQLKKHERTECNYLVLFFVVGVLTLAMTDITSSCRR